MGETRPGEGNLISGNSGDGILIDDNGGHVIFGNFIGTSADGSSSVSNQGDGIQVGDSASNINVGGVISGEANTIAFNGQNGVLVWSGSQSVTIRGNSIHSNGEQGIDLGPSGINTNDNCDADTGANGMQSTPRLISVLPVPGGTTPLCFEFRSIPSPQELILDFYSSLAGDASGYGEGKTYIGSASIETFVLNGCGYFLNHVDFPFLLTSEQVVSATATDPNGNTSEFSPVVTGANILGKVNGTGRIGTIIELRNAPDGPVLRTATVPRRTF